MTGKLLKGGKLNWLFCVLLQGLSGNSIEKSPADGSSSDAMKGFSEPGRKAHCMFGWDWGPRLPDAGLWRPVFLLGTTAEELSLCR